MALFTKSKDLWVPQWAKDAPPARPDLAEAVARRLAARDEAAQQKATAAQAQKYLREVEAVKAGLGAGRRHGAAGAGAARIGKPMQLPVHTAPSGMMKAVYPWMVDPGLGVPGAYIGADVMSMSSFMFDIWELYEREIVRSPNISLIGVLGSGKSALQKSLILRMLAFGVRFSWVQLKPEYDDLCAALGIEPLKCGPGQLISLNPLAMVRRHPEQTEAQWRHSNRVRRTSLLEGILRVKVSASRKGGGLTSVERSVIGWALDAVTGQNGTGTDPVRDRLAPVSLPTLYAALVDKTLWAARAEAAGVPARDAYRQTQDVRLELADLISGSLRGMFDSTAEKNAAFDIAAPGTLLDLSAVRDDPTSTVLSMVCAQSAMEAELMHPDAGRRLVGYDEAWAVMKYMELLKRLQEQFKLARMFGISNMIAFHRFSDMDGIGDAGSAERGIATGLLEDCGVKIAYRQEEASLEITRKLNGLSEVQMNLLRYLKVGVGVWKIGTDHAYVVKHILSDIEKRLVNTDSKMKIVRGVDDISQADWEEIMDTWITEANASANPSPDASARSSSARSSSAGV